MFDFIKVLTKQDSNNVFDLTHCVRNPLYYPHYCHPHDEHSGKSGTNRELNQASGVCKAHYAYVYV